MTKPPTSRRRKATARRQPARAGGASGPRKPQPPAPRSPLETVSSLPSFIVGLGASAGGLQALQAFFTHLQPAADMAFVIVTHRDPSHASMLTPLLQSASPLPVLDAATGMTARPGHAYVAPADGMLTIEAGRFRVTGRDDAGGRQMPIDIFFRSLAGDRGRTAIGIVLSGTGTDGTLGLKAIRADGGLTVAQTPDSAQSPGMPSSAIGAGIVDYERAPEAMAALLVRHAARPIVTSESDEQALARALPHLLSLLRHRTGVDFSSYKPSTVGRRIERRLGIHQLPDVASYQQFAEAHPHELDLLFSDLLIGVTGFFRDQEAHAALLESHLPALLSSKAPDAPLRIWVPGCSTGEEAYTIAMLAREALDGLGQQRPIHMFATDLDTRAVEAARAGVYPESIAADVGPARLARFFEPCTGGYRITKALRQLVVFATHNLLADPPFTRVDLISCRNVLIYLNTPAQQELLQVFHYALQAQGLLVLGASENIGELTRLFHPASRAWRIFLRQPAPLTVPSRLQRPILAAGARPSEPAGALSHARAQGGLAEPVERLLLERYAPAAVVVNERGDIYYIHGRIGTFLEPASGVPSMNAVTMARSGLALDLGAALRRASRQQTPVVRNGLRVKAGRAWLDVTLTVTRITEPESIRGLLLVTFEGTRVPAGPAKSAGMSKALRAAARGGAASPARLARELSHVRDTLQTTIEQLATANEEQKSANEELQSINEELQSSNEELATSREEMQSLNEELQTVNAELESKLNELSQASDDMKNLLNSTQIATIFLDRDLRIERFTPAARQVINLIDSDIGRPIGNLTSAFEDGYLERDAVAMLASGEPHEREIRTRSGGSFVMRLMPYRTSVGAVRGVVATFTDVTILKEAERALRDEQGVRAYAEGVLLTVREPVIVLSPDLRIVAANPAFYETFQTRREETEGRPIYEVGQGEWNIARLRELLERTLSERAEMHDFRVDRTFPGLGRRRMLLNARRIEPQQGQPTHILLTFAERIFRRSPARRRPPPR